MVFSYQVILEKKKQSKFKGHGKEVYIRLEIDLEVNDTLVV